MATVPMPIKIKVEDEQDVPQDFFDDFMKDDFMAGLDIVDEDNNETTTKSAKKMKKLRANNREPTKKYHQTKSYKNNKLEESSDKMLEKLDKELDELRFVPVVAKKKPPTAAEKDVLDSDNFDIRRDPEKTRQAIQRDKMRTAKDKEKKLITDIVETGLVPPGMELEVDLEEVQKTNKEDTDSINELKPSKKDAKNKSPGTHKTIVVASTTISKRKLNSPSPPRIRPNKGKSPLYRRMMSPLMLRYPHHYHHHHRRSRSPSFGSRKISPSMVRIRSSRSPIWDHSNRRRSSRTSRSSSKSRGTFSQHHHHRRNSPSFMMDNIYHRRERSYSSDLMRSSSKRRRSHSRSPTTSKRNNHRKEEKVSFLEELVIKLNESHPTPSTIVPSNSNIPPNNNYMGHQQGIMNTIHPSMIHPSQHPLMIPQQQQQQQQVYYPQIQIPHQNQPPHNPAHQNYDETYFIGSQFHNQSVNNSNINNSNRYPPPPNNPQIQTNLNRGTDKLFEDKRINLSDFLAITTKPQVNNMSGTKLKKKIKVIQRCQDAIKILNAKKFVGPLIVIQQEDEESAKIAANKNISPLLRKPIIKLPFTTPGMKTTVGTSTESIISFTKHCEIFLQRLGIEKKLSPLKKASTLSKPPSAPQIEIIPPENHQLFKPILPSSSSSSSIPNKVPLINSSSNSNKTAATQTEKELSCCKECLRRKGILYTNVGVQAGTPTLTFSVTTQVTEADFYSMIPKNQSLASLTPAQLLGKQSMTAELVKFLTSSSSSSSSNQNNSSVADPRLIMNNNRFVPSPPPPPLLHHHQSQQQQFYHHGSAVESSQLQSLQPNNSYLPSLYNNNNQNNFHHQFPQNPQNINNNRVLPRSSNNHSYPYIDNNNMRGGFGRY